MRIYWASSLFSEASRDFNAKWARGLRNIGHEVCLPQEFGENSPDYEPTAIEIFCQDTSQILDCDLIVATIDDETIDSGVAAEIGIAHAAGLPVVGVYTDIRHRRLGPGRMYKNLYVMGLIELSLGVATSFDDLVDRLQALEKLENAKMPKYATNFSSAVDELVERLESRYSPQWDPSVALLRVARGYDASLIVDFGCGTGRTSSAVASSLPGVRYIGFDSNPAVIACARMNAKSANHRFFDNFGECMSEIEGAAGNRALLCIGFVLHDLDSLSQLATVLMRTGSETLVCVQDLLDDDLPKLENLLSRASGRLPDRTLERRLSIGRISSIFKELSLKIASIDHVALDVHFDDAAQLMSYCELFGLFRGADKPIKALPSEAEYKESLLRLLRRTEFPLVDARSFVVVTGSRSNE